MNHFGLALLPLLFFGSSAYAYKAGDTLQFVGSGKDGACAVQFTIGSSDHHLNANEEFIEKMSLYTTFNNDHAFSYEPELAGWGHRVTMKKALLSGNYFHDDFTESDPDGISTRTVSKNLNLNGASLASLKSANADYSDGHLFTTQKAGKFRCEKLKPVSATELSAAVSDIQAESALQIKAFQDAEQAKLAQEAREAAQDKARVEQREQQKLAAQKEQEAKRVREEPAHEAEIDSERAANGLSTVQHDQVEDANL